MSEIIRDESNLPKADESKKISEPKIEVSKSEMEDFEKTLEKKLEMLEKMAESRRKDLELTITHLREVLTSLELVIVLVREEEPIKLEWLEHELKFIKSTLVRIIERIEKAIIFRDLTKLLEQ